MSVSYGLVAGPLTLGVVFASTSPPHHPTTYLAISSPHKGLIVTRLNQVVALEKSLKVRTNEALTRLYRAVQDPPKLSGLSRTYLPKDDEGDRLPSEKTQVQLNSENILREVSERLTALLDLTLTKDVANGTARADIVVDDVTIATAVPVTYLLFLEKQFQELLVFAKSLPVLDPAESWSWSPASDCFVSEPTITTKSKKIPRNHVKAEATKEHPAQVEIFYEDMIVGTWTQTKGSGAMRLSRVRTIQARLFKLLDAVKAARESANMSTVTDLTIGSQIFGYLLMAEE